MKTFKYTFLSLLFASAVSSCNFLDKEPYKITPDNYFTNATEAGAFLTGIYAIIGQSTFYGGDYMVLAGGDDLTCYAGSTGRISTTGIICNNATTSDPATTGLWFTLYSGIERANMFLERIDDIPDMTEKLKNQYRAEARFLRAFYYFNLVQNWGDVPFKTESTSSTESVNNKDIPRTPKDEIYSFIVNEMAEVADENTGGLLSAQELNYLPGRISKSTAWGMLARVYLFWAGEHFRDGKPAPADVKKRFERASFFGQKVMKAGHGLAENYWQVFIDMCSDKYNTTAKESIWEAEFAGDGTGDVRAEGRVGNTNGIQCADFSANRSIVGKNDPGSSYGFLWSTPVLYKIYLNNNDQERFYWNIAPFTYQADSNKKIGIVKRMFQKEEDYDYVMATYGKVSYSYPAPNGGAELYDPKKTQNFDVFRYEKGSNKVPGIEDTRMDNCAAKFRREYETAVKKNKNNTAINFPILRYSDVLLMVAEAENEYNNGPTDIAKQCLEEVRSRAGLSMPSDIDTQTKFRQAIKDERAMELCFEYTRRYDLIRWGEYIDVMNETGRIALQNDKQWAYGAQTSDFFLIPSSYNYLPIPDSERSVNKLITTNNPGW